MSIAALREQGLKGITMRYEDGGKVQVFTMDGKEVKLGSGATVEQIKDALKEAK